MPSPGASPRRRVPQPGKGERRVTELLDAAAGIIAETGYEAATMTAMAERAGASIGAMYQYFPNKEAVVRALRAQYAEDMEERWRSLDQHAAKLSVRQIVDRIFAVMIEFMETRPAYVLLLNVPVSDKRDPLARNRLRGHVAKLFREKHHGMTSEESFRVANVTLEIVKGMNPLYAEAKSAERIELVREFKLALTMYLNSRLQG